MGIEISMIAAIGNGGVIGKNNQLPWERIPADMKHFRNLTMGKPVIMGRKTFESLEKPLDGRVNIVLTKQCTQHDTQNVFYAEDKAEALLIAEYHSNSDKIMVIGGTKIFKLFLPDATRLYITHINAEFSGDTFFPFLAPHEWESKSRTNSSVAPQWSKYPLTFVTYDRTK